MPIILDYTRNVEVAVDVFFVLNMYVNCFSGKKSAGNWEKEDNIDIDNDTNASHFNKRMRKRLNALKTRFSGPLYASIFAYK